MAAFRHCLPLNFAIATMSRGRLSDYSFLMWHMGGRFDLCSTLCDYVFARSFGSLCLLKLIVHELLLIADHLLSDIERIPSDIICVGYTGRASSLLLVQAQFDF